MNWLQWLATYQDGIQANRLHLTKLFYSQPLKRQVRRTVEIDDVRKFTQF